MMLGLWTGRNGMGGGKSRMGLFWHVTCTTTDVHKMISIEWKLESRLECRKSTQRLNAATKYHNSNQPMALPMLIVASCNECLV